jgi:hypothetical protein
VSFSRFDQPYLIQSPILLHHPITATLVVFPHPADRQYAQPAFRGGKAAEESADAKQSNHVKRILDERKKDAKIDPILEQQFKAGRLLAMITSRPGQSGRADGYILEGKELDVSVVPLPPIPVVFPRTSLPEHLMPQRPSQFFYLPSQYRVLTSVLQPKAPAPKKQARSLGLSYSYIRFTFLLVGLGRGFCSCSTKHEMDSVTRR